MAFSYSNKIDSAHLAGLDAVALMKLILDAHSSAAERSDTCKYLFRQIEVIAHVLPGLRESDLSAIRNPLVETLRRTYLLLAENQKHSCAYKFAMSWKIDRKFKTLLKKIRKIMNVMQVSIYADLIRKHQIAITTTQEGGRGDKIDGDEEEIENLISIMQICNSWRNIESEFIR